MSAEGWISLHRSIRENWVFEDPEFFRAWIVILIKAQKFPKEQMFGDDLILLECGDIVTSELKLMSELKLSKTKLRRFLKLLEKSKMISKESCRKGTKLKVLNYKYFQGLTNQKETNSKPQKNQSKTNKKPIRNQKEASNNNVLMNNEIMNNEISKNTLVFDESENWKCPYNKIIEIYHSILPELPKIKVLSDKRKKSLKARWNEYPSRQDVIFWMDFFKLVKESDFLMGRVKEWSCTFDWLFNPSNFVKVLEGNYKNKSTSFKSNKAEQKQREQNQAFDDFLNDNYDDRDNSINFDMEIKGEQSDR